MYVCGMSSELAYLDWNNGGSAGAVAPADGIAAAAVFVDKALDGTQEIRMKVSNRALVIR